MAMKRKNLPEVVPELFEHEQFEQFRFIKRGEEIWFVAVDLCRALDIQNVRQNLADFPEDEKMSVVLTDSHSKNGVMNTVSSTYGSSDAKKGWIENRVTVISEPGLYRLIFMSRKPEAEKIKRWVFHEVLPSIRKYGFYGFLNGERSLQLPDKEYIRYLGKLTPKQYEVHIKQLTREQRSKHYRCLEERIDSNNMTQEEILSLGNDPYIIVSRIGKGAWKASY